MSARARGPTTAPAPARRDPSPEASTPGASAQDEALARALLADNLALTRVVALLIGAIQVLFLGLDPWVVAQAASSAANAALPWLTGTRALVILACLALWLVQRAARRGTLTVRAALVWNAAWLGLLVAGIGLLLGFSGWFQPTAGFYVAAVLFLGLTLKLPALWSGAIFLAGLAGVLVPAFVAPNLSEASLASEIVNLGLMTTIAFGAAQIGYRRRRQALADQQTIARQHAELADGNARLAQALVVAEAHRAKATAAGEAKAAFLARMSHEIRTPLHSIIGMTEALLNDETRERERERLALVCDSASTLLAILNDVLEFSRLETTAPALHAVRFDAARLLRDIVAALEPVAAKRGVTLTAALQGLAAPVWLVADVTRIRQVLANLLDNALKFSPGGRVTLSAAVASGEGDAQELVLEVADTGVGIPAERLDAIFEPFEQADASVGSRFGGTGLGLAITKQLVHLMRGRVTVESKVGAGSTFRVALPVEAVPAAPLPVPSVRRNDEPANPLRVLVVDDTPANIMIANAFLKYGRHQVHAVSGGTEALEALATQGFDVVLMDIQMPDIDGVEASRRWRARERERGAPRLPIVAVTAHTEPDFLAADERALFDGFLTKPFARAHLLELIARVTGTAAATADAGAGGRTPQESAPRS